MKRKWITGLILAAAALLGGCGKENNRSSPDSPVTITIWHYYNGVQQTQFDELVDEFNDTVGNEQGIIVEANSRNSVEELASSVMAAVKGDPGADTPPNIFGTYMETAYQIDKLGQLADLSQFFTEEELDEYVDEYIQEGAFAGEGTLKIFPTAKSTEALIMNATDWQAFADSEGVSYDGLATWEGLIDTAEKYYEYTDGLTPETEEDGKAFFGMDSVANYLVVGAKQLGHPFAVVSEDGTAEVSVDKETMRRLWENYYVPYVKGYFTAENRFRSDDAKIGAVIAILCSTTGATYYPTEVTVDDEHMYPVENIVLPAPNFEGCEPYIVQQGAGMSVLKSDEKTEYACAVFLKWFTENEQNIQFAVNSGYLPVRKDANDIDTILSYESAAEISRTVEETFRVAIDEIHSYTLYTSPPYEHSAKMRDYIEDTMEDTAAAAREEARERIAAGEERSAVLAEYTDPAAFEDWYDSFEKGFYEVIGE